jgi:hypothetical protein
MSVPPARPRPRSVRSIVSRVCAALLAVALTGSTAGLTPLAAASAQAPSLAASAKSTEVGELTYSDGAGSRTWGLRKHAAWSTRVVKHRYAVGTVGGYRASSGDHGDRLAADFMVYSNETKGEKIARFAKKHHRQLNITYVIWDQRIWSVARAGDGWRRMSDLGSVTANHKDHVHISFRRVPRDHTYQR